MKVYLFLLANRNSAEIMRLVT